MSRRRAQPTPQVLLIADALQGAGLEQWLVADPPLCRVARDVDSLDGAPSLVIWSLTGRPEPATLLGEVQRLQERWQPAPLLLLLPAAHRYLTGFLLELPLQGLLELAEPEPLRQAVRTLLEGGRVIELSGVAAAAEREEPQGQAMGLGQWLLLSGLQQIDAELRVCRRLLEPPTESLLSQLLLQGRVRELNAARQLLLWLWGPATLAWSGPLHGEESAGLATGAPDPVGRPAGALPSQTPAAPVALTLRQRTADGIWEALRQRLQDSATAGAANRSGQLLALDGLHPDRRSDLLLALLEQFELLRTRLQQDDPRGEGLLERWRELQPELRRTSLRRMAGSYVQLPLDGNLRPVADTLVSGSQLGFEDPELPDPQAMLGTLIQARPLLVEGRLLPPDEPQAVLYLEMLLANWLVRSAEVISAEVLAACAEWPELRRYLLRPDLLATRNLERLRNQLNAQMRWSSWFERPVQLYESRRPLYRLQAGVIDVVALTEPRDRELRQLSWPQQLVTLALEARDALAPQLQSLVRSLGDLVVVVLTRVVGRAIGLVGRGIVQGMGRSIGR